MTITEMAKMSQEHSVLKGFTADLLTNPYKVYKALVLIHGEVTEAVDEYAAHGTEAYYSIDAQGNNKPEGIAAELADVVLRIGNLSRALGLDLEAAIIEKHTYNLTRGWRHGKEGTEGPG